jgi:hypothetical protein
VTGPDPSQAGSEPAITYSQAQDAYPSTIQARERFDELTNRGLSVRAYATLKARGTYDPAKHGDADRHQPLTAAEHLELLAVGEILARHYRHPALVHQAVQAGVTWPQIAEAVGSDEMEARNKYREWAECQHHLHTWYEGKFGLNDADYATAIRRAAEPPARPGSEREAGQ